jgi:hypothetical protein
MLSRLLQVERRMLCPNKVPQFETSSLMFNSLNKYAEIDCTIAMGFNAPEVVKFNF